MMKIPEVIRFSQLGVRRMDRIRCERMVRNGLPIPDHEWRCKSNAQWKIDGKPLCNRHAGYVLLLTLEKADETNTSGDAGSSG